MAINKKPTTKKPAAKKPAVKKAAPKKATKPQVKRTPPMLASLLRVDCCGWESYREAVSYIVRISAESRLSNAEKEM